MKYLKKRSPSQNPSMRGTVMFNPSKVVNMNNFETSHDVAKHLSTIYNKRMTGAFSNDLRLASLDDKERRFVIEIYMLAKQFKDMIEDDKVMAEQTYNLIMDRAYLIIETSINRQGNWLPKLIMTRSEEEMELEEKEDQKRNLGMLSKLFKKKKGDEDE